MQAEPEEKRDEERERVRERGSGFASQGPEWAACRAFAGC